MALTQDDINNIVNGIVNTYTNQRIAYHGGYPGECTSPVKYYVENITGQQAPYMANNRADGWGTDFPAELAPFFYHEAYQPGKAYPKGTILMWNSPHIAIVVYDNGSNSIEVFEQNADPDGAPCKTTSRVVNNAYHTCTYALIPIVANPQPTPPPTPAPKYTVIENYPQGKQIQLNKQPTNLWGMNYDFNYMKDHPVEVHNQGEIWTVTNKVHHEDGYDYYRRDGQVDGFNVADCDDYTPPAPPYVPPAAPVPVNQPEKYEVLVQLDGFKTAANALNQQNYYQPLGPGSYFVYKRDLGMVNLSTDNMKPGVWVNPKFNELPASPTLPVDPPPAKTEPVDPPQAVTPPLVVVQPTPSPAPIKPQYRLMNTISRTYDGPAGESFPDLEGKTPNRIALTPGKAYDFSMEAILNGQTYYILDYSMKRGYRHAVPKSLLYQPNMLHEVETEAETWGKFLEVGFKSAERLITDIKPKLSQSAYRGKQFLDGFKAGKKQ